MSTKIHTSRRIFVDKKCPRELVKNVHENSSSENVHQNFPILKKRCTRIHCSREFSILPRYCSVTHRAYESQCSDSQDNNIPKTFVISSIYAWQQAVHIVGLLRIVSPYFYAMLFPRDIARRACNKWATILFSLDSKDLLLFFLFIQHL